MALILIVVLTIANAMTAVYCIKQYASRSSILQLCFVIVWTMHYVVGNALVLLSRDLTYTLASFERFQWNYLLSLAVGQYFLWMYLLLLDLKKVKVTTFTTLRVESRPFLLAALIGSLLLAIWFIAIIGVEVYYSQQLAQFRARLGDYAFEGIGVFYYLAGFLLPATILAGALATAHFNSRNVIIFILAFLAALLVFVPLGGRGRIVNIVIVLVLHYIVLRGQFRIRKLLNWRIGVLMGVLLVASYAWGVIRETGTVQRSFDPTRAAYSLSVDSTRLPFQAFIFDTYPPGGTYYGTHYLEALLGPFYSMTGMEPAGLITDVSARWYYEVFFGYNVQSAISPSYIGEAYIAFGIIGVILAPALFVMLVRLALWIGDPRSALTNATVIYFVQFNMFHGGLYALFDMLLIVLPILIVARIFSERPPLRPPIGWRGQGAVGPVRV